MQGRKPRTSIYSTGTADLLMTASSPAPWPTVRIVKSAALHKLQPSEGSRNIELIQNEAEYVQPFPDRNGNLVRNRDGLGFIAMGKGAPLRWLENRILRRYLSGTGVEIGALGRPFPLRPEARVWYLDRQGFEGLQKDYGEIRDLVRLDVIADAGALPFASLGLNFIIASHVLEHLPLPILALQRWYETLSPNGVLLLKVPDKRFTFDSQRDRTTLEHLLHESAHPDQAQAECHFADWVEHILGAKPSEPHFEAAVQDLIKSGFNIHYHVWTDEDVHTIIDYTVLELKLAWSPVVFWHAHFYRKEMIVVLKKTAG